MPPRPAKRRAKVSLQRTPAAPAVVSKKKAASKKASKKTAPKSAARASVTKTNKSLKKVVAPRGSARKKTEPRRSGAVSASKKATPARDARQALTQKRAIAAALAPAIDGKAIVDAYLREVDHPFRAEMQAVREIVLGVSPKISERIKWNAPSFYAKEDLGAFNPRATEFAHLILLFPNGRGLEESSPILEGQHKDRREVKFYGMDDVKKKKGALEKIVRAWVALHG